MRIKEHYRMNERDKFLFQRASAETCAAYSLAENICEKAFGGGEELKAALYDQSAEEWMNTHYDNVVSAMLAIRELLDDASTNCIDINLEKIDTERKGSE